MFFCFFFLFNDSFQHSIPAFVTTKRTLIGLDAPDCSLAGWMCEISAIQLFCNVEPGMCVNMHARELLCFHSHVMEGGGRLDSYTPNLRAACTGGGTAAWGSFVM